MESVNKTIGGVVEEVDESSSSSDVIPPDHAYIQSLIDSIDFENIDPDNHPPLYVKDKHGTRFLQLGQYLIRIDADESKCLCCQKKNKKSHSHVKSSQKKGRVTPGVPPTIPYQSNTPLLSSRTSNGSRDGIGSGSETILSVQTVNLSATTKDTSTTPQNPTNDNENPPNANATPPATALETLSISSALEETGGNTIPLSAYIFSTNPGSEDFSFSEIGVSESEMEYPEIGDIEVDAMVDEIEDNIRVEGVEDEEDDDVIFVAKVFNPRLSAPLATGFPIKKENTDSIPMFSRNIPVGNPEIPRIIPPPDSIISSIFENDDIITQSQIIKIPVEKQFSFLKPKKRKIPLLRRIVPSIVPSSLNSEDFDVSDSEEISIVAQTYDPPKLRQPQPQLPITQIHKTKTKEKTSESIPIPSEGGGVGHEGNDERTQNVGAEDMETPQKIIKGNGIEKITRPYPQPPQSIFSSICDEDFLSDSEVQEENPMLPPSAFSIISSIRDDDFLSDSEIIPESKLNHAFAIPAKPNKRKSRGKSRNSEEVSIIAQTYDPPRLRKVSKNLKMKRKGRTRALTTQSKRMKQNPGPTVQNPGTTAKNLQNEEKKGGNGRSSCGKEKGGGSTRNGDNNTLETENTEARVQIFLSQPLLNYSRISSPELPPESPLCDEDYLSESEIIGV